MKAPTEVSSRFKIRKDINRLKFSATLQSNESVDEARRNGQKVLHMGFGQSPFPVHPVIRRALCEHSDKNMYLPTAGLEELRVSALNYYAGKFGFNPGMFTSIIGPGSKEIVYNIQLAIGGGLLLPVPSWVSYGPQSVITHDSSIKIHTKLEDNYHLTADVLEKTVKNVKKQGKNPTKLIINCTVLSRCLHLR